MRVSLEVYDDSLAEAVADLEYEDAVKLFLRVDEIQQDSAFTEMVFDAFEARYREDVAERADTT